MNERQHPGLRRPAPSAETEGLVDRQIETVESATTSLLGSDIGHQIATAHKHPRSITTFLNEAKQLIALTVETANECIYALPREGKTIEGPSARFAEIVAYSWGNARAGARVVGEDNDFVTAQGVYHDLEKNVAITYEVKRRIVDKYGKRYKPDMIGVTANAACSIALRNAVLKGVPKALWAPLYETARQTIMGTSKTLNNRRADGLATLQKLGATEAMVLALLGAKGVEDISLENLVTLGGIATAIKEGDTTVEQAFAAADPKAKEMRGELKQAMLTESQKIMFPGLITQIPGTSFNKETGEITGEGDIRNGGTPPDIEIDLSGPDFETVKRLEGCLSLSSLQYEFNRLPVEQKRKHESVKDLVKARLEEAAKQ